MLKTVIVTASILITAIGSAASSATFTDKAAFLAASGSSTNHTGGVTPQDTRSETYSGGLTISALGPLLVSASQLPAGDNGIPNALLVSGVENLNFDFSAQRFGFGLNIFEPTNRDISGCNTSCEDSVFTFTFKNAGTIVGSETFAPKDDVVEFFGVVLTSGVDRVEMREFTGKNDNEFFGGFVSTDALAPVPLPASAVFLLGGLAGLRVMRRRQ